MLQKINDFFAQSNLLQFGVFFGVVIGLLFFMFPWQQALLSAIGFVGLILVVRGAITSRK